MWKLEVGRGLESQVSSLYEKQMGFGASTVKSKCATKIIPPYTTGVPRPLAKTGQPIQVPLCPNSQ